MHKNIKRFNAVFEIDLTNSSAYFYIPPNSAKNPAKVQSSEQIVTESGHYNVDYNSDGSIIGFEIMNGDLLDLKSLGIKDDK